MLISDKVGFRKGDYQEWEEEIHNNEMTFSPRSHNSEVACTKQQSTKVCVTKPDITEKDQETDYHIWGVQYLSVTTENTGWKSAGNGWSEQHCR
jgi:hypothetical protein